MSVAKIFVCLLMALESGAFFSYTVSQDWRRAAFWACTVVVHYVVTF